MRWLTNDELIGVWKEPVLIYSRYYTGIFVKETEGNCENSVRIFNARAEIRAGTFLN
jgi:hypothetical protein